MSTDRAPPLSPIRRTLCSRDHALRVATQMFDRHGVRVSIIRTGDPLQPFRVSTAPDRDEMVELDMVS